MKPYLLFALASVLLSCTPTAPTGPGSSDATAVTSDVAQPQSHADGKPFRVAVVQSGAYYFYNNVLASIHGGLADLGWTAADSTPLNPDESIPQILERWKSGSANVLFDPALFVDLNFTEDTELPAALKAVLDGSRGADLVVSLGTVAGRFCAQAAKAGLLKVPVMIESVSDPLGSGIIASIEDSGYDLLSASVDPDQYERQVRLFERVIKFKRLGLIYTDTETGRAYAALSKVKKVAAEQGFEVVPDTNVLEDPPDEKDIPKAETAYLKAFERLAQKKVDAVYLAIQAGFTTNSMPAVLALSQQYKIPTFAMEGADFVRLGALLGESSNVLTIEGLYGARKLTRILTGALPRSLAQTNSHMTHIALNLATAKAIGFDVPVDVLLGADDVFTKIQPQAGAAP
jgi:ABC-type uncharacterized transport system substrate-binding protein